MGVSLHDRRGVLTGGLALMAGPAWAAPVEAPPQSVTNVPVRDFKLSDMSVTKLKAFGSQGPAFVTGYIASRTGSPTSWTYEDGCIWKGALDLFVPTQDQAFIGYVKEAMQTRVLADGALPGHHPADFTLDNINASKVLLPMWQLTGEARFRKAVELPIAQLRDQPRTQSGNYWHKQVYPNQVWLDGVYMAQPLQTAYARIAKQPIYFTDTLYQLRVIETVMKKRENGLYYHGWDASRKERWADPKTGLSQCVWGRAMGWWTAALVDIYQESEGLDPASRADVARITRDTLMALIEVRSKRGLWYQVMDQQDREGNYEEASASLMVTYGLLKGARLGIVGPKEKAIGLESLRACIDTFLTPEALNGTCSVAGLGGRNYRDGTYAYYLTEKVRANDAKGVGPLFWALSEAMRA
jgi:unsaturated rhamnogalacturonyl hydrolase